MQASLIGECSWATDNLELPLIKRLYVTFCQDDLT